MISLFKVLTVITARAGSKGVPNKNLRLLCDKPLIAYTIEAALGCSYVDKVVVSTDGDEISKVSKQYGAEVIKRPQHLATDMSLSEDAIVHAIDVLEDDGFLFDLVILLQPTSPLRTVRHLVEAIKMFHSHDVDCLISITETDHSPYKCYVKENEAYVPIFSEDKLFLPRQKLQQTYRDTGAIYIVRTEYFKKHKSFYCPGFLGYLMSRDDSLDIDTEIDLEVAAIVMNRLNT